MSRQVSLAVLALVLITSSVRCFRMSPGFIRPVEDRLVGPRFHTDHVHPGKSGPDIRPSSRLILLVLRQRCQRLINQGVPFEELPTYCFRVLSLNSRPPPAALNNFYDAFAGSVSRDVLINSVEQARRASTASLAARQYNMARP